jgi:hypothetical protein
MDEKERAIRQRLKDDFEHYAGKCLKIRTKAGAIVPLELNAAQRYIHQRVEEQRAKTGKVRAVVLKGRQQGCSTYIEGRFYWRVSHTKGVRAFILTHEEEATNNLFELADRYHENCPALVKPSTSAANAKELHFDKLDSGYKVGTAGNKAVGRSSTVQLFHGSEVGFWPNAQQHAAGILQAIPDEEGTEVFKESTANGVGNYFHKEWQDAEAGLSEYIAIFVPWYWSEEYRKDCPEGFQLDGEEEKYRAAYGLSMEQMAWRRAKIIELKDPLLFKQEYPATAAEAFQVSGADPYIGPDLVLEARKAKSRPRARRSWALTRRDSVTTEPPSAFGRRARFTGSRATARKARWRSLAWSSWRSREAEADQCAIDVGGLGAGVYDRVAEIVGSPEWDGPACQIVQVNSSESPIDAKKYTNKRAEMWGETKEWLAKQPAQIPGQRRTASGPDPDSLQLRQQQRFEDGEEGRHEETWLPLSRHGRRARPDLRQASQEDGQPRLHPIRCGGFKDHLNGRSETSAGDVRGRHRGDS